MHKLLSRAEAGERWQPRLAPIGELGPCPACHGSGEVFNATARGLVTCSKCGGSGQFRQGVPCCDASRKCLGRAEFLEIHRYSDKNRVAVRHLCAKHARASAKRYGLAMPEASQ